MKRLILKNKYSKLLIQLESVIVLVNVLLIAELNTCYLFYSVSLNIVLVLNYIIKNYSSKKMLDNFKD